MTLLTRGEIFEVAMRAMLPHIERLKDREPAAHAVADAITARLSVPEGWQDIASAPDEDEPWGGTFLAYAPHAMGGYCLVAARNMDGVIVDTMEGAEHPFTLWMPLPAPPPTDGGDK